MRTHYIFIPLFLFCIQILVAQGKHDYVWLQGIRPNNLANKSGGTMIDFKTTPPTITYFALPRSIYANASISDGNGNLLFYTNGCMIFNRNHEIMVNGDSINSGFSYREWCAKNDIGYPTHQGMIILPYPGSQSVYVLVHYRDSENPQHDHAQLLYTLVDMTLDNGLGAVTVKNSLIYEQEYFSSNLTSVRHGNGRDWWIVAPKWNSTRYFKFLLSPQGFSGPGIQDFGPQWVNSQGGSQACFSPDGSKYIRMRFSPFNANSGCLVANFDRCDGTLSNALYLPLPGDTLYSCGCAVSPNNRFLYVSAFEKVYQYDLSASNVAASRVLLGVLDSTEAPLRPYFFQAMPTPDGKIYLSSSNGGWVMHVIHNPNEKGLACNFEQHGIELPTQVDFPIPNFPHYRLYELAGSPCDTLGVVSAPTIPPQINGRLRIFPNPAGAGEPIRVEAGELFDVNDRLFLYNELGQLYGDIPLPRGQSHFILPAGTLLPGVYFLQLQRAGRWEQAGKIVIGK